MENAFFHSLAVAVRFGWMAADPTDVALLAKINEVLLELVDKRVHAYTKDGVTYTMLDIDRLRRLRQDTEARINAATRGEFGVAVIRSPGL